MDGEKTQINIFRRSAKFIIHRMWKYRLFRMFYTIADKLGLFHFLFYLLSFCDIKYPAEKIEHDKAFFPEHARELKEVYDSLEDERSKSVYENILKYRVTADWAYLRKSRSEDSIKTQYFVPEIRFSDHEIIVDCGAYSGDTVKLFYKKAPGCKVIALEPEKMNFKLLQKLKLDGLKLINCGAWSEDTTLSFSDKGGSAGATISDSGNTTIETRALDHLPECQSATYIKMDIEGAELEALKGAENIIKREKPKLAISIYHRPQDIFEIPLYIKKLNPDYKLFVHHHHPYFAADTILYAV